MPAKRTANAELSAADVWLQSEAVRPRDHAVLKSVFPSAAIEWLVREYDLRIWKKTVIFKAGPTAVGLIDCTQKTVQYMGILSSELFPFRPQLASTVTSVCVCEGELHAMRAAWELHLRNGTSQWATTAWIHAREHLTENPSGSGFGVTVGVGHIRHVLLCPNVGENDGQFCEAMETAARIRFGLNVHVTRFEGYPFGVSLGYTLSDYFDDKGRKSLLPASGTDFDSHTGLRASPVAARIRSAAESIARMPAEEIGYAHSILCQVGIPRRQITSTEFLREIGDVKLAIEAGRLMIGGKWVMQPLPYGVIPRLILMHISAEAILKKTREIELGNSVRSFLERIGMSDSGGRRGRYESFKKQMMALAACRLTLGFQSQTVDAKPISEFVAWYGAEISGQTVLWDGSLTLSKEFYDSLIHHAVPMDLRCIQAISHSALALDVFAWLTSRLYRISPNSKGLVITWAMLRQQFGQEYKCPKNFKKEFLNALKLALQVYPTAKVGHTEGGLFLRHSPPSVALKP